MKEPQSSKGFVTVVSGLPRSGTSLLMQMLAAGGMGVVADSTRRADQHNPRGYFELDAVKRTATDPNWVAGAVGKAVKVIHLLIPHLPSAFDYRILFVHRDADEVLASQRAMLDAQGRRGADLTPQRLAEVFAKQVRQAFEWAAGRPNVSVLEAQYRDLIAQPAAQARRINQFLGGTLDEDAMAAAVDPALYRQRGSKPAS